MQLSAGGRCFLLLSSFTIAACSESTSPPKPASVAPDQTVVAEGVAGSILANSPSFVVKDAGGAALSGVGVTVVVSAGGGLLTDAPTSTRNGATPVGTWKLGNTAGLNSVTVTVGSLPPLVISVTGKAGPPASVSVVSGGTQVVPAGTDLPVPPIVQVRDQFGNGVSGIPVSFTVTAGRGTVSSTPSITDGAGNAAAPAWRLGKSAEPQSLSALAGGFITVISAIIQTSYDVEVRFFGPPMPAAASAAFTAAAARIRGAVIGDLPNTAPPNAPINLEQCGATGVIAFSEGVDDVIIYAAVADIDGPGRVLAFAGPCLIRSPASSPTRQTVVGVMKFDAADLDSLIARGTLTDVIQHEMIHVVGLGTLWSTNGLIAGARTPETRYVGALGVAGCVALGGATVCPGSVPAENTGSAGTADSHWRETTFDSELMTGFVERPPSPGFTGVINPFSSMTIQSLADLGYIVNSASADPYTIPGLAARAFGSQNDDRTEWEQVVRPLMEVSRSGKVTSIRMQ